MTGAGGPPAGEHWNQALLNYDIRQPLATRRVIPIARAKQHPGGRTAYFRGQSAASGQPVFVKAFAPYAAEFAEREARALRLAHPAQLAPDAIIPVYGQPWIFVFPACGEFAEALPPVPADAVVRVAFAAAAALVFASLSSAYARAGLLYVDLDPESFRVSPEGRLVVVDHDNVYRGDELPLYGGAFRDIPTKDDYLPPEARAGGREWFYSAASGIDDRYGLYQLGKVLRQWLPWDGPDSRLHRALRDGARVPPPASAALDHLLKGLDAASAERRPGSRQVASAALRILRAVRPSLVARHDDSADRVAQFLGGELRAAVHRLFPSP